MRYWEAENHVNNLIIAYCTYYYIHFSCCLLLMYDKTTGKVLEANQPIFLTFLSFIIQRRWHAIGSAGVNLELFQWAGGAKCLALLPTNLYAFCKLNIYIGRFCFGGLCDFDVLFMCVVKCCICWVGYDTRHNCDI